jgi:hypothetical protein
LLVSIKILCYNALPLNDTKVKQMLDDIFSNNENRLRNLRKTYSADTVASMVNDTLKDKDVNELVTGSEIDGFLKISGLGKRRALVSRDTYNDAMDLGNSGLTA